MLEDDPRHGSSPAQDFAGKDVPPEHTAKLREALAAIAPADPLRNEPDLFVVWMFDVALATGLRLGELRALRWRDVDFERKVVRVARAYSRTRLSSPKTEAGVRSVSLFPTAREALRGLAGRALERGRYAPDELVFGTAAGRPVSGSWVGKRWRKALARAKLAEHRYRWHDLRHTCVSRLVAAGADVRLVQEVAGHASPLVTLKRYTQLREARLTEAADRYDPAALVADR